MTYLTRSEASAVQEAVSYRCVNPACARLTPRRVNFCPFCGTSQHAGVARADEVASVPSVAPVAIAPVSIVKSVAAPRPLLVAVATPPPMAPPQPAPLSTPAPPPHAATPASPPQRKPVKLRYWLLALGVLWLIWIMQRPSPVPGKIDARIESAVTLASACKAAEARDALAALKGSSATLGQLQRLEALLNEADLGCDRKRTRAKPAPAPKAGKAPVSAQAESARNLIADARQALALGNYKSASDKMEVCLAMVDAGNRECGALKVKANRLQGEMQRCQADEREWIGERCQ